MREAVETDREAGFVGGPGRLGSHGLRLLQPWVPNNGPDAEVFRSWPDDPEATLTFGAQRAVVPDVEPDLGRPPARVVMEQVIAAWRSAERRLAATVVGSLERPQIQTEVATLRSLYQGLFAQVRGGEAEPGKPGR